MDEYISREEAKKFFNQNFGSVSHAVIASRLLDEIPAADVSPVRHGHFVHDGPRFSGGVDWWHCSGCGRLASGAETRFCYCPNCGAKMDLEDIP